MMIMLDLANCAAHSNLANCAAAQFAKSNIIINFVTARCADG